MPMYWHTHDGGSMTGTCLSTHPPLTSTRDRSKNKLTSISLLLSLWLYPTFDPLLLFFCKGNHCSLGLMLWKCLSVNVQEMYMLGAPNTTADLLRPQLSVLLSIVPPLHCTPFSVFIHLCSALKLHYRKNHMLQAYFLQPAYWITGSWSWTRSSKAKLRDIRL